MPELLKAPADDQVIDLFYDDYFDYDKAKIRINDLIDSWSSLCKEAEQRRNERYIDLDVEGLRKSGDILPDETFVPQRVIDTNISRELPEFLAFLKQSNRLAIFTCISNPEIQTDNLEKEFTKGLTFQGWYKDFKKLIDGSQLHGWDSIEVVFDETKPLHVGFEHIGFDKLFYNKKTSNLQDSEYVIRRYDITLLRLEQFKSKGFSSDQIDVIISANTAKRKRDDTVTVYKVYYKYNNAVWVCWYSRDSNISSWLKDPEKLKLGIAEQQSPDGVGLQIEQLQGGNTPSKIWIDKDVGLYPIFQYLYKDDEEEILTEHVGRGFLDLPMQEAQSAIVSGFTNGLLRAANVYASPTTDDGESADIKQLDVELTHGGIYSKPLNFFHTEYPDPLVLTAMQYLATLNSQSTGKTSFAVSNRKDSRKTAKELSLAETEEKQQESIGLADFSEDLRAIFSFVWIIVQSQALQGKIPFLQKQVPIMIPSPTGEMIPSSEMEMINDSEIISKVYEVRPAGDVDVIERQNKLQQMRTDWPVIQTTALAQKFIQDYLILSYPDKAEEYTKILQQGDIGKQLVASLSALVKAFASEQDIKSLTPQQVMQLKQIEQQATQYLGMGQQK
ncbi:MAG TPA: hypothetical protein VF849_00005 [Blattabacteriaceae bacterium]